MSNRERVAYLRYDGLCPFLKLFFFPSPHPSRRKDAQRDLACLSRQAGNVFAQERESFLIKRRCVDEARFIGDFFAILRNQPSS